MTEFIMLFCDIVNVSIVWKPAVLHFFMAVPLCAHTARALSTGRYPLQSGLNPFRQYLLTLDLSLP